MSAPAAIESNSPAKTEKSRLPVQNATRIAWPLHDGQRLDEGALTAPHDRPEEAPAHLLNLARVRRGQNIDLAHGRLGQRLEVLERAHPDHGLRQHADQRAAGRVHSDQGGVRPEASGNRAGERRRKLAATLVAPPAGRSAPARHRGVDRRSGSPRARRAAGAGATRRRERARAARSDRRAGGTERLCPRTPYTTAPTRLSREKSGRSVERRRRHGVAADADAEGPARE